MDDSTNIYMVKAAWYYYIVGYTQNDIASMLGLSRAKVVRLLDEAREQGVVQFTFRASDTSRMGLEQEFINPSTALASMTSLLFLRRSTGPQPRTRSRVPHPCTSPRTSRTVPTSTWATAP